MTGNRSKELDIIKAVGIFLMIFDHVGWGDLAHTYIQSFHMPLFFIVSGYLWRPDQSTKRIAQKRFKTILIPYFSFSIVYFLILMIASLAGLTGRSVILALRAIVLFPTDMQNMPYAPALWFLPCFYLCNLIYAFLSETLGKTKWIAIIMLAVAGFTYSSLSDYMLPLTLEPLMVVPLFMLIGELIKNNNEKIFHWLNKYWILVSLIILDCVLVYVNGSCDLRSARYHNCVLYIIDAVLGTLILWGITRKILRSPKIKIGGVSYLSIYAISFLGINQFAIMLCEKSLTDIVPNSSLMIMVIQKLITLIITIIICISINELIKRSKIKFMIGR